jgi:hypothetical protein
MLIAEVVLLALVPLGLAGVVIAWRIDAATPSEWDAIVEALDRI